MSQEPPSWGSGPGQQQPASPAAGAVQPGPVPVGMRFLALVWNESTKAWEPASPVPLAGFPGPGAGSVGEEQLTEAVKNKLNPSAWTELVKNAEKVENAAAGLYRTAAVRGEQQGQRAEFRGAVAIKELKEINVGNVIVSGIPVGLRPPQELSVTLPVLSGVAATSLTAVKITPAGEILAQLAIAAGNRVILEGFSYPLT